MMRNIGLLRGNPAAPARMAAMGTILLGLASLTGWVTGVQALTSIIPGAAEMKANTAVGFVLCGISLMILAAHTSLRLQRFAQLLSGIVLILGIATLLEYLQGRAFGIDEMVLRDRAGSYNVFRGRMSPFTATAFVALAAALAALPQQRLGAVVRLGAAAATGIGAVSLLGYLWGAGELITDRWLPPVAVNTATCFALLGGGVFLTPKNTGAGLEARIAALAAVEIKILSGFIIALGLLLVGGSYTYRTNAELANSVEWVAHTQEVRSALGSIYGSLAGAEVALRDFLLAKEPANLAEYQRSAGEARKHLDDFQFLTRDNPEQQANAAALRPIVAGRLAAMANALTAFDEFGLPAARAIISTTRRIDSTREVHAQIDRMDAAEIRLLEQRQSATIHTRATTLISLLGTVGVALGLFTALFSGIHKEMRARRDAEAALRDSDRYTRSILDSSPDCLAVLTLDGRLSQMTPQGLRLMDITNYAAVDGTEWAAIWTGAERIDAINALASARSGVDGRFRGYCPTQKGVPKWWDVIVMPILGADGHPARLLTVSRDISDVKRGEDELKETGRFLDSLFEALPLTVVVKDARTLRYVRINRECERMTGMQREAMMGKTAGEFMAPAEAASIEIQDREALTPGRRVEIKEEIVQTPELGQRTCQTQKLPVMDESGTPRYLLAISVDVTEQKLAEQAIRELNIALLAKAAQLETTNKELESFSYSVSHDLRAPLRAIDGFALMIEEDCSERLDAEGRRYLAVIRDNSKRMGALIDDLLEFSRLGRLPVVTHEINIEALVHEVVKEMLNGHGDQAPRIEIGPLPPAQGDRGLLRQVWTNLIANAIKYSGKKAHPYIKVSGDQTASENLYSVSDNGVGFNMAYVEKLFGVFQRLHRADEFSGTGVGLAIVHRVVTRHGGRVWAEGTMNEGAVFSFALPKGDGHG